MWAQHFIGSDLAKEHLIKKGGSAVEIAVIDNFKGRGRGQVAIDEGLKDAQSDDEAAEKAHGFQSLSILNGANGVAFGHDVKAVPYSVFRVSDVLSQLKLIGSSKAKLVTMSLSLDLADPEKLNDIAKGFDELRSKGISTITAAGNFNATVNDATKISSKMIVVGNMSIEGIPSESRTSQRVAVAAPAGSYGVPAYTKSGKAAFFGGTSAATQEVGASLANALFLVPDLTPDEQLLLIKKTAQPILSSFQEPQLHGAGLLNAYKIVRVAERLNEKCSSLIFQNELERKDCRLKLLDESKQDLFDGKVRHIYDFSEKSSVEEIEKVFSFCHSGINFEIETSSATCADKKAAFRKLREMDLLGPPNSQVKELLDCIYSREGYWEAANFYRSLALRKLFPDGKSPKDLHFNAISHLVAGSNELEIVRYNLSIGHLGELNAFNADRLNQAFKAQLPKISAKQACLIAELFSTFLKRGKQDIPVRTVLSEDVERAIMNEPYALQAFLKKLGEVDNPRAKEFRSAFLKKLNGNELILKSAIEAIRAWPSAIKKGHDDLPL